MDRPRAARALSLVSGGQVRILGFSSLSSQVSHWSPVEAQWPEPSAQPQGTWDPVRPSVPSPALRACPQLSAGSGRRRLCDQSGALSSPAWEGVNGASKTEKRPVSPSGIRVPAAVRPTWSAIPSPQDCTNSPSCICIKISCKEQLALH